MKKAVIRFTNGFCYSIGITTIIQLLVILITKKPPLLPEYIARFDNPMEAFALQLILIGIMSGITSAGTVVFEEKKLGLVVQSILFLIIMLAAWIPVSCIVWISYKYTSSMIATILSIVATYAICWGIAYRLCKQDVEAINEELSKKEQ